jgi:biotin transporter BioY
MSTTTTDEKVISLTGLERASGSTVETMELDYGDGSRRPLMQRLVYPPRLSLNGLLIGLLCIVLIVFMSFITMPVPSPLNLGTSVASYDQLQMIHYTLQIPMMLFVAAFLGPFMGIASVFLYLMVGLFVAPVFANGGGLQYLSQPGFGYLLGGFIAAFTLGRTFHYAFQKDGHGSRSLKIIRQVLQAVFTAHLVGILYLVGLTILRQLPLEDLPGWVLRLSVEPLGYDILATLVLLCLVRQFRLALMLVLY